MDAAHIQGSRIRLISKSEIRYEGTLSTIDPPANTVSLKNVRMHGTEGRQADRQIAASDALYDFIIFRGSDIKDLTVYEDDKRKQDFIDPAVVTAQPARGGANHRNDRQNRQPHGFNAGGRPDQNQRFGGGNDGGARGMFDNWGGPQPKTDRRHDQRNHQTFGDLSGYGGYGGGGGGKGMKGGKGGHMERPEFRNNRGGKGGKVGGHRHSHDHGHSHGHGGNRQFEPNNRRHTRDQHTNPFATHTGTNFKAKDEEEAAEKRKTAGVEEEFNFTDKKIDKDKVKEEADKEDVKPEKGYDKKSSFFDSLSCEATERSKEEGAKLSKAHREKLRKYDIDTFGADAVTAIERSFHRDRGHKGGRNHAHGGGGRGAGGRGGYARRNFGPPSRGGRGGMGGASRGGGQRW